MLLKLYIHSMSISLMMVLFNSITTFHCVHSLLSICQADLHVNQPKTENKTLETRHDAAGILHVFLIQHIIHVQRM